MKLRTLLCLLMALIIATSSHVQGYDAILESDSHKLFLSYPNVTIFAKFPNGTVYTEQKFAFYLLSISEGTVSTSGPVSFTPEKVFDHTMIRANWSAQAINDTVQLLDNVTSGRQRLHTVTIFPEGGNLTLDFEIYDTGGRMQWGTNVVNITAGKIKYNAYINNWTFAGPTRRLRILLEASYISGPFFPGLPEIIKTDWDGPTRNVKVTWPQQGPLTAQLTADAWALADGLVGSMPLAPNPTNDLSYIKFSFTPPCETTTTFGWILPLFQDTAAWDPTVLLSLFSPGVTPPSNSPASPQKSSNKNLPIIIGSVTGGVVLIVVIVAVVYLRNPTHKSTSSSIRMRSL